MASDSSVSLLDQIDQALGRYYSLHGRDDYFDSNNVGKFKVYAEEEGFETDEAILSELDDDDQSNCILCDFDDVDEFPIQGPEPDDRYKEIFAVIQECVQNKDAYKGALGLRAVTAKDFKVSKKDIKNAIEKHSAQCKDIFKDGKMELDKSLLQLVAMSQRLRRPYLIYLADMYQRERVLCLEHGGKPLEVNAWCLSNKLCQELGKTDQQSEKGKKATLLQDIRGGISSYFDRIMPKLLLTSMNGIVDSLTETCEYIAETVSFVSSLANDKTVKCPFQYDAVFAFNKVIERGQKPAFVLSSDDEDEDIENDAFFDCFGDIKQRLACEKLLFSSFSVINNDDEKENDALKRARMLKDGFRKFKNTQIKQKYEEEEFEQYPRKHRFCSVIDRRKPNDGNNKDKGILDNDELIFYEPPNNCNAFPKDKHVPLFYFDTSRQCVIPSNGYNEGDNNEVMELAKESHQVKQLKETITSKTSCNGAMIMLSFHVEAADEIRCYMYMNGQSMRFLPSDVKDVLPRFFDKEFGDNDKFAQSERAQQLVDDMEKNLRDDQFNAFLKKYQSDPKDYK